MFELIGKPFVKQVQLLYPFIATYRGEERKIDYFNNIIQLYSKWSVKIKQKEK